MTERGQTIHDYLLGIVLLMLTIAGVFAFFPEVFTPFQGDVETEDRHMADQLSNELLGANRTVRGERTVSLTALNRTLQDSDTFGVLLNRSGIPRWKQVNVTIRQPAGVVSSSETGQWGSIFRDDSTDPTATEIRTIQAQRQNSPCTESCQLVVRVWEGG